MQGAGGEQFEAVKYPRTKADSMQTLTVAAIPQRSAIWVARRRTMCDSTNHGNGADQRKGECEMPQIRVMIKKREFVEYFVSRLVDVSDDELAQIQNRPLQAKYWAENVAPYNIDQNAWHELNDGRKTVSFEAVEVEVSKAVQTA